MDSAATDQDTLQQTAADRPSTCLLVGVCGTGMRSLAQILIEAGYNVKGTDITLTDVTALSTEATNWPQTTPALVAYDHPAEECIRDCDVIVTSLAVPDNDRWVTAARRSGLPRMSLPEFLGSLWDGCRQICVAGTHGKTTTTALIHHFLSHSGGAPGLYLGGQLVDSGMSGHHGRDDVAVIESCEYQGAFLKLRPDLSVLTGIDRDHLDCYPTDSDELDAYRQFLQQSTPHAISVVNADDPLALECARRSPCRVITFGVGQAADIRAQNIQFDAKGCSFDIVGAEFSVPQLRSSLSGRHNVSNLLASAAAALVAGTSPDAIAAAASTFAGVRRRFEYRGRFRSAILIDDYAHHPTAVRATLVAARQRFPERRIVAVFEPHQVRRLQEYGNQFCEALLQADECLILPVLPVRENWPRSACLKLSGQLVRRLNSRGGRAFLMANLDQAIHRLDDAARDGDVVITMGAGRTNQIHDELNRKIQRDHAA